MIHDLRLIRAFLALARAGSFTRAASELHMSQPTLTVQIQQLETGLGVKLFDRNKRHVALTQAGRDLLVPLERILIDVEAIATNAEELLEHRRGLVTVAALPSVAAGLLPRAIKKLTEEYPGITVRVYDGVASTVAAMVRSGQVDFGISSQTYGDRELTSHVLMMDRLCAVVASNHPLARKRRINLRELKTMFFVGMSEKTHPGFRDWLCETCRPAGFTPRILQDAELEPALMTFVAEGLGVTLAREHIKTLPHPGVAIRPLAPPVKTDYYIAWNRDNESRALQQYIEIVKSLAVPPS